MNFCGLLRARCERPRGRDTAEKGDELPSPHGLAPQVEDHTLAYRRTGAGLCITAKWAADVGDGSKAALTAPKSNFRFTPESGLKSDITACPKSATTGRRLAPAGDQASSSSNAFASFRSSVSKPSVNQP